MLAHRVGASGCDADSLYPTDDGARSLPPPGLLLQELVQPPGPAGGQRLAGLLLPAVSISTSSSSSLGGASACVW